jgi:uncharacterized caspase-like protein
MASYAVIVGVNHYTPENQKGLKGLQGAIHDATNFYDWVTTKGGIPKENCHLITSSTDPLKPIKDMVDDAIIAINDAVIQNDNKDADRLYFYFAGHGLGVELDQENNGMCMANWAESRRDAAALSSSDYKRKFINEGLFKEVVILMDCCRNTKMYFTPHGSPGIVPLGPNITPKWMVGFATQHQNEAFEANLANTDTRGVFTKVLLDGLNGAASKDGRTISAGDLIDHLYYNVPIEAQAAGFNQKPDILNNLNAHHTFYFIN